MPDGCGDAFEQNTYLTTLRVLPSVTKRNTKKPVRGTSLVAVRHCLPPSLPCGTSLRPIGKGFGSLVASRDGEQKYEAAPLHECPALRPKLQARPAGPPWARSGHQNLKRIQPWRSQQGNLREALPLAARNAKWGNQAVMAGL